MDIVLARTFLEIVAAGNFVGAARRLNVTQSTISMRARSLEQQLGRPLFIRNKTGTLLTPAGQQFLRYATSLIKVWEEARQQVAIPPGYRASLVVGGQYSLWDRLMLKWLPAMERRAPDVALRAEVGMPARLMREMAEGIIDIGVMYRPQLRPGLKVERLFDDELVLVSTDSSTGPQLDSRYVFIDWGPEFCAAHAITYPDYTNPGVTLSLGALGLAYVLENRRAGYFPKRVVRSHLDRGRLHLVEEAPVFPYPAYVIYDLGLEQDLIDVAIDEMRKIARAVEESSTDREVLGFDFPRAESGHAAKAV
ncbi:MAG: LysR family transcriptional regulator [Rhodospirillales bacterium]|nr:LysR family transcriptional regulator [Rhodospirillales bacterium]